MAKPKTAAGCLIPFAIVWIGGWSAASLTFDSLLITAVFSQLTAYTYSTAPGEIVSIETGPKRRRGKTISHKTIVRYRYTVDAREYAGDTSAAAALDFGTSGRRRYAGYVAGKKIPVYYDPRRPKRSVLWRGLDSGHAMLALFLMPFNIIMLTGWLAAWDYLIKPTSSRPPRGVRFRRNYEGFRLGIYDASPLTVGAVALFASTFLGIFLVAFGQAIFPEAALLSLVWLAVIAITGWAYLRQRRQARVLEVNELRGIATLHDKPGDATSLTISLETITDIQHGLVTKKHTDGDTSESYCVSLVAQHNDASQQAHELASGWTEASAKQLADWLRARLQLSGEKVPPVV